MTGQSQLPQVLSVLVGANSWHETRSQKVPSQRQLTQRVSEQLSVITTGSPRKFYSQKKTSPVWCAIWNSWRQIVTKLAQVLGISCSQLVAPKASTNAPIAVCKIMQKLCEQAGCGGWAHRVRGRHETKNEQKKKRVGTMTRMVGWLEWQSSKAGSLPNPEPQGV
jgi:hypothetical protein